MMKKFLLSAAIALPFILTTAPANAHLYWMEPNEFYFYDKTKNNDKKVSEKLSWEFTGGDTYFNADVNRAYQNVENYDFDLIAPNGKEIQPTLSVEGKNRMIFEADIEGKGTYILAGTRTGKPMYYTKLDDGEWIHKGDTELTAEERKRAVLTNGYFQHVKTYSSFHTTSDVWKAPLGHTLEVVPLSGHPNKLYEGDELRFSVLYNGKPLANSKVKVIDQNYRFKEHGNAPQMLTTDKNGEAVANFPLSDRYLIHAEHTAPLENDADAKKQNHRAGLMLEVNKRWVKSITK
jgi:uncharacterized GH25 family protein